MGRKDRERFLRLKESNPGYQGFRGADTVTASPPPPAPVTEAVTCSVCQRRRNVNIVNLPADRSAYICLRCQQETPAA